MITISSDSIFSLFIEALLKAIADQLVEYILKFISLKVWGLLLILLLLIAVGLWIKQRSLRSSTASTGDLIAQSSLAIHVTFTINSVIIELYRK